MRELAINVSVEQANLILEGLGQLPFARVYDLVAQVQKQAKAQLNGHTATPTPAADVPRLPAGDPPAGDSHDGDQHDGQ